MIEDTKPWAMFLGGKWTKTRPQEPGFYPVATREGAQVEPARYKLLYRGPEPRLLLLEAGVAHGDPGWLGWWWDRPLPMMPRAPSKEWSEV